MKVKETFPFFLILNTPKEYHGIQKSKLGILLGLPVSNIEEKNVYIRNSEYLQP